MRAILVATKDIEVARSISACFPSGERVDRAADGHAALEMLRKRRYDFIFIDVAILRDSALGNDYKTTLQQFWRLYPTVEIIVMSPQETIREAVMAVKAGASNYLTYPINRDEVKYVIDSLYEFAVLQSELDYLRDKYWRADEMEIIQTRSPEMKRVFEKVRSVHHGERGEARGKEDRNSWITNETNETNGTNEKP